MPLPPKRGTPSQQTQLRTPAPSPPSHPAASALRSSSSAKTNTESAAKYGSAAASLPPQELKLPPKDPQTRQIRPAHIPARGLKRRGGGKGGKGAHLVARPPAAPAARDSQQRRVAATNRHRRRRSPRQSAPVPAPAGLVPEDRGPPLPPIWIAPLVALQPSVASRGAVRASEAPDEPRQPGRGARPRCRTRSVPGAGPKPKESSYAAHSR